MYCDNQNEFISSEKTLDEKINNFSLAMVIVGCFWSLAMLGSLTNVEYQLVLLGEQSIYGFWIGYTLFALLPSITSFSLGTISYFRDKKSEKIIIIQISILIILLCLTMLMFFLEI